MAEPTDRRIPFSYRLAGERIYLAAGLGSILGLFVHIPTVSLVSAAVALACWAVPKLPVNRDPQAVAAVVSAEAYTGAIYLWWVLAMYYRERFRSGKSPPSAAAA